MAFRASDLEAVFQKLVEGWPELNQYYQSEVADCTQPAERLYYVDMGDIGRFIVNCVKTNETAHFEAFFQNVEAILNSADDEVTNLMVVGLFESIQNIGGKDLEYHRGFDQWLGHTSLQEWRALIDSWEGTDWKRNKEAEQILKHKKIR